MSNPMQTIIQAFAGTSTIPTSNQSSSAQTPPDQAVTAAQLSVTRPQPNETSGWNTFFEKWGVPLGGMLMTGIIGYFSAILPLKDDINENKTEISVAKKEIENVQENIKRMEDDVNAIPKINTEIAVMQEKLTFIKKK